MREGMRDLEVSIVALDVDGAAADEEEEEDEDDSEEKGRGVEDEFEAEPAAELPDVLPCEAVEEVEERDMGCVAEV